MTTTLPLKINLPGRVRNMRLAPSNALFALYEAVVNGIHAVLDGPDPSNGRITIRILRGVGQMTTDGKQLPGPVIGFEVHDNGVGFDNANFESFSYSDSTAKAKYGGKGVGRLLWLKVFNDIRIVSVYQAGTTRFRREFRFSTAGISTPIEEKTDRQRGTTVTMKSAREHYKAALQHDPESIAVSTIGHCLEYFIGDNKPHVYLIDSDIGYEAELGDLFASELQSEIKRDEFSINGSTFRIAHLLLRGRRNSRHAIHFCAHLRRVKDEAVSGRIAGLSGGLRLPGSHEDLAYQGYVSGDLLDQLVDAERANFDFEGLFEYDSDHPPNGTVSYDALVSGAVDRARAFLEPVLNPILAANEARIRREVEDKYPQYRYLLKHRSEEVAAIPVGSEGRELDLALYKIEQRFDADSREALNQELAGATDPDEPPDERRARLDSLLSRLNDSGMSKLARHVAYRRAVIEFLDDQLGLQSNGRYSLEDAVHAAVCPTRTSSDEVSASKMNLWLLDDRLYFHYYLASDLPFEEMKDTVARESEDRPDLAIFHRQMAFSDSLHEIGAVVIVEFKRPSRDDYHSDNPKKNPITQVLRYVDILRNGKAKGAKGQAIHIRSGTPFYAYIVADITPSLRKLIDDYDFMETPDGDGYFWFNRKAKCYFEVITFQKMIRDAKKRNQAFFDKLNIPMTE